MAYNTANIKRRDSNFFTLKKNLAMGCPKEKNDEMERYGSWTVFFGIGE
jgi:hypothetical protein